jgi:AcrR family transcriptional regulator
MPRITEERRAARRRHVLHAARLCFQREGLHATTMDDIIRASGLSAGAVYGYFKSKDELILAAIDGAMSDMIDVLRPMFRSEPLPPPGELMHRIMHAIATFSAQDGVDLKRVALLGWGEAQRSGEVLARLRHYYDGVARDLADAVRGWQAAGAMTARVAPHDMAHALLAIILGYVAHAAIMGEAATEAASRSLLVLLGSASPQPA